MKVLDILSIREQLQMLINIVMPPPPPNQTKPNQIKHQKKRWIKIATGKRKGLLLRGFLPNIANSLSTHVSWGRGEGGGRGH